MTNTKPHYVEFKPDDWLGGTAGLPPDLEYVFFRVCLHNWATGQPIHKELIKTHCKNTKSVLKKLVALTQLDKVVETENGFYNSVAIAAFEEAQTKMNRNINRTAAATAARQDKNSQRNVQRNDQRNVDRNVQRNVDRNVQRNDPTSRTRSRTKSIGLNNSDENVDKNVDNRKPIRLTDQAIENGRKAAPGWDIYSLQDKFVQWANTLPERPRNPGGMFVTFCKNHAKNNDL